MGFAHQELKIEYFFMLYLVKASKKENDCSDSPFRSSGQWP